MRTNLIQTYMNTPSPDRNLDIEYVLSNRTFIKPLPGRGHIVNNNIFEAPAVLAKDIAYDFKSLNRSEKGKANDHELGKVNDLGMKLGGLALAFYLMTRKQTPMKKLMEFVGFGTFFGAMALWPKIALQYPAKLIHGFNIRKEYVDSYGRKKPFFQDPQYLPWDLVDENKLNKIGDRLDVPKDIPNRRDFIQEKMKKIAVQNNTLWMLTAGFATPVMSALICNALERPLNKYLDKKNSEKADKLLNNIGETYKAYFDKESVKQLEGILKVNTTLTPKYIENIGSIITKGLDPVTADAVKSDLKNIFDISSNNLSLTKEKLEIISENLNKKFPSRLSINPQILAEKLSEYIGKDLSEPEIKKVNYIILSDIKKALTGLSPDEIEDAVRSANKAVKAELTSSSGKVLNEKTAMKLRQIMSSLADFRANKMIFDKYIYQKVGAAPETAAANAWNEVTSQLPKIFNISNSEMESIVQDRKFAGKLLRQKLESICSNPAEYKKVFAQLADKIKQLDNQINSIYKVSEGNYETTVNSVFEETAKALRELGMNSSAETLVGKNGSIEGSLKNIQLSYAKNRILGIRSSMYRLLNTMDFYKRISSLKNIEALHNGMPKEVKEELVELAKQMSIDGATSDFMTKFHSLRNPRPAMNFEQIETKAGKVINEFADKAVKGGKVDIPQDKDFFQEIMKLLFENNLHPDTEKILSGFGMQNGMNEFRGKFLNDIGGHHYFAKFFHRVENKVSPKSSYRKFLLIGNPPDQMLSNAISQMYNTRKWLKMFGGFGAVLFILTVLAQFSFGKMRTGGEK